MDRLGKAQEKLDELQQQVLRDILQSEIFSPQDPISSVQVVSLEASRDGLVARKKQGRVVGERLMRLLESVDAILVQSNMPELKDRRRAVAR